MSGEPQNRRGRPRLYTWYQRAEEERKRATACEAAAKNWKAASAFLMETRQMKAFLMWEVRRGGGSDWLLATMDRALDKIVYPELPCNADTAPVSSEAT